MTTANAPIPVDQRTRWQLFWTSPAMRKLRRNPLAITGLLISVFFALVAIFAPLLAKPADNCLRDLNLTTANEVYNPLGGGFWRAILAPPQSCYKMQRVSFAQEPSSPSSEQPMGTVNGYSIYYGLVWGTRTALKLAFIIEIITLAIGVVMGAISGYYGGWVDNLIQRFIDIIFALPGIILTVVILTILRAKNPGGDPTIPIIIAFCVAGWAGYARVVRGDVLRTRELEYVDAARGLGARDWRLIARHIIPNSITTVFTIGVMDLATTPLAIAALSFLGLGFEPGYSEWGQLINFARAWLKPEYWYVLVYPAAVIIVFSLAFNLFGDGLRDALDPKTR
ncbi:peptide/nickel transport system permease protein [Deinococcus metalli]|uniref:Peptide ABC transporter permease n=1 Tax=Deinococcus metalli TaxID=1141878 RepID=A0A7W8NRM1_9DEIO|nr:ABC transporter permease [Deinococcus metalli]MBB5376267.1 peptide/nickel transport system permease protein [Deinococcus metalli]GHF39596.1 peptide ABC transporter permease [Deinococcus metalli]